MGEIEARNSARPVPATNPEFAIHTNWDVLSGKTHFVPQPVPPADTKHTVPPPPDYMHDLDKDGGLAMYRDPYMLSRAALDNFNRFDLNHDSKLSLPELKLIENSPIGYDDDRKLAFALDRGFAVLQSMSGGQDAITKAGLEKFNHVEDFDYMYALEHHGGSDKGLLGYLGTGIATGAICWRLGLSFWPAAVVATAAATAAFYLIERPHNRQQDQELSELRPWQPKVDDLIKSVQAETSHRAR